MLSRSQERDHGQNNSPTIRDQGKTGRRNTVPPPAAAEMSSREVKCFKYHRKRQYEVCELRKFLKFITLKYPAVQ